VTSANTRTAIPTAGRVNRFTYAIRNIVAEAQRVEAAGTRVRYLNIGDPVAFGFKTPLHLVAAVEQALRDGHNGYGPSAGIAPAREAVAAEYTSKGFPVSADRVFITAGTSEGIELTLSASVDSGGESARSVADVSSLYGGPREARRAREVLPARSGAQLDAGSRPPEESRDAGDARAGHHRSNNPTGAVYPTPVRRALLDFADEHGLLVLADEVYGDLGFDGAVEPYGLLDPDAAVISFSSLSKAYLAPGWRTGWMAIGRSSRLDDVVGAVKKLADGRLCSTVPMEYAVMAALQGDRSHQVAFRDALRARATVTVDRLRAIPGISCVAPTAAFYAMPRVQLPPGKTDEDYVLSLLRATGVLCVYGSGFGLPPEDGFLRIVFLAPLEELAEIYDLMAAFTAATSAVEIADSDCRLQIGFTMKSAICNQSAI